MVVYKNRTITQFNSRLRSFHQKWGNHEIILVKITCLVFSFIQNSSKSASLKTKIKTFCSVLFFNSENNFKMVSSENYISVACNKSFSRLQNSRESFTRNNNNFNKCTLHWKTITSSSCFVGKAKHFSEVFLFHRRHSDCCLGVSDVGITPQLCHGSRLGVELDTLFAVAEKFG
jgi:hypothetical protein